jgi:hypothetical protein
MDVRPNPSDAPERLAAFAVNIHARYADVAQSPVVEARKLAAVAVTHVPK